MFSDSHQNAIDSSPDGTGHVSTRALAQRGVGSLAATRGDSAAATGHRENALAVSRAAGDRHGEGRALLQLGHLAEQYCVLWVL
jgi:hypothetical protein